jgi:hypothetical protein
MTVLWDHPVIFLAVRTERTMVPVRQFHTGCTASLFGSFTSLSFLFTMVSTIAADDLQVFQSCHFASRARTLLLVFL